jgi:exodeoxyribonuclease VII large subunit
MRASARRGLQEEGRATQRRATALARRATAASGPQRSARERRLDGLAAALAAHDPQRTLDRGYALVEDAKGNPVTDPGAARAARTVRVRFADGTVGARIEGP